MTTRTTTNAIGRIANGTRSVRGERARVARSLGHVIAVPGGGDMLTGGGGGGNEVEIVGQGDQALYRITFSGEITGSENLNQIDQQQSASVATGRVIGGSDTWFGTGDVTVENIGEPALGSFRVEFGGETVTDEAGDPLELGPGESEELALEAIEPEPADIAVTGVEILGEPPFEPGQTVEARITAANQGAGAGQRFVLVDVVGGASRTVNFSLDAGDEGTRLVQIQVPADAAELTVRAGGQAASAAVAQPPEVRRQRQPQLQLQQRQQFLLLGGAALLVVLLIAAAGG